ncbi:MAG TPA: nucleotidyl transferase AbiEii/AbiGii toxin family protein [Solirubrobacterales bacterium]
MEKVIAVDRALSAADLQHAFGGALAYAYYGEPRTTIDIDVNVFVSIDRRREVEGALEPLPIDLDLDPKELAQERQARLPWDLNPVHLFFSFDDLHAEMPNGTRRVPFAGAEIPIVAPEHLVIRKAMLDRTKDWLDIEAIFVASEPLDLAVIEAWVRRLAGDGDDRLTKLQELARRPST